MSKAVQRKWCTFVNFSPYILGMETFTIWHISNLFWNWCDFISFSKFDMITKKIERKNSNTIVLNTKITNIPGISIKYRLNQLYFQNSKNKTICFKVPVVRWLFLKCICVSPKEFHFLRDFTRIRQYLREVGTGPRNN